MIFPVVLLSKRSNWLLYLEKEIVTFRTTSCIREVFVSVAGWGALGCPHAQFVFSLNVAINYKIVAVIITVIIAEVTFKL